MRILVEAHHPAHIHVFKYPIRLWQERGHEVKVAGRDREIMVKLATAYPWIPYTPITRAGRQNLIPLEEFAKRQILIASLIREFRPHVFVSAHGSYSQSARILNIPNVVFTDTEHQRLNQAMVLPFASVIYTPDCFTKKLGPKQKSYAGYHELSYLHPSRFRPDPEIPGLEGKGSGWDYVIVRLSSWNTLHDIGHRGIGMRLKDLVAKIEKVCRAFIVPEGCLPEPFEYLRLPAAPHQFHDALSRARLVISEGASTASEAACLGIPVVYINPHQVGYVTEQSDKYGLAYSYRTYAEAEGKIGSLLEDKKSLVRHKRLRDRMLEEKIDVAQFIADKTEEYAKSS